MKKHLLFLLLAMSMPMFAQTTYNLTDSPCAIQGSNYLFCSQLGTVTIDGTQYGLSMVTQIANLYQYPASGTIQSGTVSFENLTNAIYTEATPGSTSTYENYNLTDNFSGGFNGTLTFTLQRRIACGRYGCRPAYWAHDVMLTVQ